MRYSCVLLTHHATKHCVAGFPISFSSPHHCSPAPVGRSWFNNRFGYECPSLVNHQFPRYNTCSEKKISLSSESRTINYLKLPIKSPWTLKLCLDLEDMSMIFLVVFVKRMCTQHSLLQLENRSLPFRRASVVPESETVTRLWMSRRFFRWPLDRGRDIMVEILQWAVVNIPWFVWRFQPSKVMQDFATIHSI